MKTKTQRRHYSRMDLTREIKENYIELNNQDIINRDSLVEAVLSKWPKTKIEQDLWCRKELVFAEADRFLRAIKRPDPPAKEEQLDLPQAEIHPGYKRLQKRYGVIRKKRANFYRHRGDDGKRVAYEAAGS